MARTGELFPPGPGKRGDPANIILVRSGFYNHLERWLCRRCLRGGMTMGVGGVDPRNVERARKTHQCRPFLTDGLN